MKGSGYRKEAYNRKQIADWHGHVHFRRQSMIGSARAGTLTTTMHVSQNVQKWSHPGQGSVVGSVALEASLVFSFVSIGARGSRISLVAHRYLQDEANEFSIHLTSLLPLDNGYRDTPPRLFTCNAISDL